MSLKIKLTSTILAFCLILGLLVMGVFATSTATVNLGGSLSFSATNVHAKVAGTVTGAENTEEANGKLPALTFKEGRDTTAQDAHDRDVLAWSDCDLTFKTDGTTISLVLAIENLASDRVMYARVNDSVAVGNIKKSTQKLATAEATSGDTYNGEVIELAKSTGEGTSVAYIKITLDIKDKNTSLLDTASWGYKVELNNDKPAETTSVEGSDILKYDSTKGYYYVEMGTYGEKPVRWRYVSDVTGGIETAERYAPSTILTPNFTSGSKGMFILESEIFIAEDIANADLLLYLSEYSSSNEAYWNKATGYTDVLANDYAASDLRAYLNGENNVAGKDVGSIFETINLETSNAIYSKIQKRSLTELYASNNDDGSTQIVPTQFNSTKDTATDAFWALSYQEAYRILGNNSSYSQDLIWHTKAAEEGWGTDGTYYWLRSPSPSDSSSSYFVYDDGHINDNCVDTPVIAPRPAFILEF